MTANLTVVLPQEYPYIVLACAIICFECLIIGTCMQGGARFKTFTEEFMTKFKDEHQEAFGKEVEMSKLVGGWPDSGDGRFSQKLPYKQRMDFN